MCRACSGRGSVRARVEGADQMPNRRALLRRTVPRSRSEAGAVGPGRCGGPAGAANDSGRSRTPRCVPCCSDLAPPQDAYAGAPSSVLCTRSVVSAPARCAGYLPAVQTPARPAMAEPRLAAGVCVLSIALVQGVAFEGVVKGGYGTRARGPVVVGGLADFATKGRSNCSATTRPPS